MKLKALMLALFVAGFSASFALANDGHGDGKGQDKSRTSWSDHRKGGDVCRPRIEVEVAGTVSSASAGSLALLVSRGGGQGAQLKGKQLTFDLSQARVKGTPAVGSLVRVHGRACVDLVAGTVKLFAREVKAYGAKGHGDGTTSSTTSTTASTSTTTTSTSPTTTGQM